MKKVSILLFLFLSASSHASSERIERVLGELLLSAETVCIVNVDSIHSRPVVYYRCGSTGEKKEIRTRIKMGVQNMRIAIIEQMMRKDFRLVAISEYGSSFSLGGTQPEMTFVKER
jgi:hypothetical protein